MPFYMCSLLDGVPYYFAANGRINGGPGGPSSPTISGIPYNASAATWTAPSPPANGIPLTTNLYGVGYTSLTTCGNAASISAAGTFAAVGAGGAIFTSSDGKSWTNQAAPSGFTTDLYAVTGYAASQNNPANPALRWVAVGAGGASVYSTDGITWSVGGASNLTTQALRSITQVTGNFFAVGDAGTIISSTDGNTWTSHTSGTPNNLNGVAHGGIFVAVGDNETILISGDGNTWTPPPTISPAITSGTSLRQVASFVSIYGSIYVAVGDNGTIVTSDTYHGTNNWSTQTLGSANMVGITVESRGVDTTTVLTADTSLGFVSTAQFVAVDSTGKTYTSVNGYTWAPSVSTGISCSTTTFCGNPLVSSGFGYVAAGNAGATAYAF